MRLGQTSFVLFLTKLASSLLGFVATVYFARALGEEVLGYYYLILAVVTWLAVGGNVGLTKAVKKRVSEGQEPERYVGGAVLIMAGMIVAITGSLLLFRRQVDAYVGVSAIEFIVLILIAKLVLALVLATLEGQHLVHVSGVLSVTKKGTQSLLQIGLVIAGFELAGMLVGYVIATLLAAIVGLWYLGLRPGRPARRHVDSLVDFAKYSWLGGMRSKTFSFVDVLVLGFFVPAGLIGVYSVAWSVAKILDLFSTAINTTLFPEMSKVATAGDREAVSALTEDALTYAGLFLIPGLVGAILIGDRLMLVYGEGFGIGYDVLWILVVAVLVYAYMKQLLNTLNAIDRPDLAFRANAVFVVANIVLNVVFVSQFGWVGAAVATAIAAVIGLLVAFRYTRPRVAFRIPSLEIGRQVVAGLTMGVIVYGGRLVGETTALADFNEAFVLVLVGVGATVYFTVLLTISAELRTVVTRNLPFDLPVVGS